MERSQRKQNASKIVNGVPTWTVLVPQGWHGIADQQCPQKGHRNGDMFNFLQTKLLSARTKWFVFTMLVVNFYDVHALFEFARLLPPHTVHSFCWFSRQGGTHHSEFLLQKTRRIDIVCRCVNIECIFAGTVTDGRVMGRLGVSRAFGQMRYKVRFHVKVGSVRPMYHLTAIPWMRRTPKSWWFLIQRWCRLTWTKTTISCSSPVMVWKCACTYNCYVSVCIKFQCLNIIIIMQACIFKDNLSTCCPGLWDVFKSKDASNMIYTLQGQGMDLLVFFDWFLLSRRKASLTFWGGGD